MRAEISTDYFAIHSDGSIVSSGRNILQRDYQSPKAEGIAWQCSIKGKRKLDTDMI